VRHVVLPELRRHSPGIDTHLVSLAARLADDEAYFAGRLEELDLWIDPWRPDGGVVAETIRGLPSPIRTRWLHAQADRAGFGRVSRRQVELFHDLVSNGDPRAVTLASRWRIVAARGRLWLEPPRPIPAYAIDLHPGCRISLPIPHMEVAVDGSPSGDAERAWRWKARADVSLTVRSPRPGDVVTDRGTPLKVSSILSERLPRHLRRAWPLFCENDTISWIPGVWQASERGNLPVEVVTHGRSAGRIHR
jgi:hypothetical protein